MRPHGFWQRKLLNTRGHRRSCTFERGRRTGIASSNNRQFYSLLPQFLKSRSSHCRCIVAQPLITVKSSSQEQETKTFQEKNITVTGETTEEDAPTVSAGDEPPVPPEIPPPPERGLQKQKLRYDWSALAARCTEAKLPASHLLKDLSEAFNARLGISELGLSSEEALSFMEQAFSSLDYEFRFKDQGWIVTSRATSNVAIATLWRSRSMVPRAWCSSVSALTLMKELGIPIIREEDLLRSSASYQGTAAIFGDQTLKSFLSTYWASGFVRLAFRLAVCRRPSLLR